MCRLPFCWWYVKTALLWPDVNTQPGIAYPRVWHRCHSPIFDWVCPRQGCWWAAADEMFTVERAPCSHIEKCVCLIVLFYSSTLHIFSATSDLTTDIKFVLFLNGMEYFPWRYYSIDSHRLWLSFIFGTMAVYLKNASSRFKGPKIVLLIKVLK